MTGSNYLLDTNIISALFKGEMIVADKITEADKIYIPVISIGELLYGIEFSNSLKYVDDIEDIKSSYPVLNIDVITCSHYGSVKASFRRKGQPIPENDIWISALALQYNLTLATRDKHFDKVEGLLIEKW